MHALPGNLQQSYFLLYFLHTFSEYQNICNMNDKKRYDNRRKFIKETF